MKPLPSQYFENYADPDPNLEDRSYSKNWKGYGFSRFEDYLKILSLDFQAPPKTCLELGSADGSVIRHLMSLGIETRGVEFSKDILSLCDIPTRKRITRGDATEVVRSIPDSSYDVIYETSAQYIKRRKLPTYFKNLHRITKRDLVIVLHTIEDDPTPHDFQVNHLSIDVWVDFLEDAGFVPHSNPTNLKQPFYFKRA